VQQYIYENSLLSRGSTVVVAVSGGPDSICLARILIELKTKYNLKIIGAHVNYGLRGTDSQKDEEFVRKFFTSYGEKIEVSRIKPLKSLNNLEERLRNIRYTFFEKVRSKYNADYITTAHTLDDQAETVLMRIIRGAGLKGISGMKPKSGFIIRPLLNVRRSDILSYLKSRNEKYRVDKTNFESDFTRNKIRLWLIPQLEKKFNPQIKKTLAELARIAGENQQVIENTARKFRKKHPLIKISSLMHLESALVNEIIFQEIEATGRDLRNIESSHIREIFKILKSTKSKKHSIEFKGLKIERSLGMLKISRKN